MYSKIRFFINDMNPYPYPYPKLLVSDPGQAEMKKLKILDLYFLDAETYPKCIGTLASVLQKGSVNYS